MGQALYYAFSTDCLISPHRIPILQNGKTEAHEVPQASILASSVTLSKPFSHHRVRPSLCGCHRQGPLPPEVCPPSRVVHRPSATSAHTQISKENNSKPLETCNVFDISCAGFCVSQKYQSGKH